MLNNETISSMPNEFIFAMGYLIAISSLLFMTILVLVIIFLLLFQQRDQFFIDQTELKSDTDLSVTESQAFELEHCKCCISNPLVALSTTTSSCQLDIDEQKTESTINLVSSV